MRKPKASADRMTRQVRRLFETGLVQNLTREELAGFVSVPLRTLQNWLAGGVPQKRYEAMIAAGLERIDKELGESELEKGFAVRPRAGSFLDPKDPRVMEEKRRQIRMKLLFYELERRLSPAETELLVQELPAWTGFEAILGLLRRHGLTIPRW